MRQVAIIGIGQTKIDEHWDRSLRDLASDAITSALHDAERQSTDALFIGNMLSSMVDRQNNLSALVADWSGLRSSEAVKIEAACGSGAAAFRSALIAVASGEMDSALAVGVEKMTDRHPHEVTSALATAADADYESEQGISFVGLNALIMQRYMHDFNWQHADFANFSINAHVNALSNPWARLHTRITLENFEKAGMITSPINLLDASPIGDGAAAIYLVPAEQISQYPKIIVTASASATDTIAIHDRSDALFLKAAYQSSKQAYQQSGLSHRDIDFFELHDAFSIMSALSLEACGFSERGQGPRLALDGQINPNGSIPICTRGGLKARGHPVGATGIYQLVEVVQQLRGACAETQVPGARIGMAQNIGGSGATILTHILQRIDNW